jgi:hypothetical protein
MRVYGTSFLQLLLQLFRFLLSDFFLRIIPMQILQPYHIPPIRLASKNLLLTLPSIDTIQTFSYSTYHILL